ncbi:hydantoinase B/oxoprolinase family protein [Antrihabitans sp. YC2-6]|uniref:hydantoinase B/oxoprolinase family protein n=1 Tax=Antrihabitans sp. YC2-6 TaxID=2799498 RepID=UPI001F3A717B|nr:hydantoinase B/oxoprolinase family protein [Antrihabitans sp. YC2-6]
MALHPVAGSDKFVSTLTPTSELRHRVRGVALHDVSADDVAALDALTYEVVRHRIAAITEDMGDALKRMSGSVVVTDCNDFGTLILDEGGDSVQMGLFNTQLAAAVDLAVKWTLENRTANPGIREGDMFFCNDPWVGGGLHQNDASVLAPLFYGGELFCWTGAVAHQVDLGGVSPGSWSVDGMDVFWESIPIPPIKIVEAGELRADIEDSYLRRSRVPKLVALDLRAKIGANNVAHDQLRRLIDKYGPTTVKAVMRRMMDDAESRVSKKLTSLPDGTWTSVAHQDGARAGDREVHKIVLTMSKVGDRLTFDFTGTDQQVDGISNCTFAGLRGGIMPVLLTLLCGDIPWSPGGISRRVDIISEPGTLNNCTFPAGIGKASVASAWATQNAATECVASMLAASEEHKKSAMAVGCGTWDLTLLAGVDQRGAGFATMLCDAMAGGMGARVDADGVDTGGGNPIAMGRVADAEMNEFSFPILYLWRREEADSGGAGRFRGGLGGSSCFVPHDSPIDQIHLVLSATGKALPQAPGLSGGYPANTQFDVLVRGADVAKLFANKHIPANLEELGGDLQIMPAHLETELTAQDVYFTHWQGGGGYGDPLLREPHRVAVDVERHRVSAAAATTLYGVVIDGNGDVDEAQTETRRHSLRRERAGLATDSEERQEIHHAR